MLYLSATFRQLGDSPCKPSRRAGIRSGQRSASRKFRSAWRALIDPNHVPLVADGFLRVRQAALLPIRQRVEAEYAEELKAAGFFRKTVQIQDNRTTHLEFFIPLEELGTPEKNVAKR